MFCFELWCTMKRNEKLFIYIDELEPCMWSRCRKEITYLWFEVGYSYVESELIYLFLTKLESK